MYDIILIWFLLWVNLSTYIVLKAIDIAEGSIFEKYLESRINLPKSISGVKERIRPISQVSKIINQWNYIPMVFSRFSSKTNLSMEKRITPSSVLH